MKTLRKTHVYIDYIIVPNYTKLFLKQVWLSFKIIITRPSNRIISKNQTEAERYQKIIRAIDIVFCGDFKEIFFEKLEKWKIFDQK